MAAIDIGSNSIRSIVVEVSPEGKFRILDDEKVTVRLAEGMNQGGAISPVAWDRAVDALVRFRKIVQAHGADPVVVIATSAVRSAVNGREFVREVERRTGLSVEVISGEEEGELAVLSALNNFEMGDGCHLVADIGGGSLELAVTVGHLLERVVSLELGAVVMTERFFRELPPSPRQLREARRLVSESIRAQLPPGSFPPVQGMIGSGGTIVSMGSMVMSMRREAFDSLHGYELLRSDVVHLHAMLSRKDLRQLREVPGLNPDRADIILAGVTVIDQLMEECRVNLLKINDRGIREGIILRALRNEGVIGVPTEERGWRASVLDLARLCHVDERHALTVADLCNRIAQLIAPLYRLGDREQRMLEAAAILHDVGYFINYSSHHKHSYHLIRHANLLGFTPRERELVAQIARYHRKSLPRKKHEPFMKLSPEDRLLVSRLGGILRLADGLDRRRSGRVAVEEGFVSPSRIRLQLVGDDDLSVELYGAEQKKDLFERAFGLELTIETVTKR